MSYIHCYTSVKKLVYRIFLSKRFYLCLKNFYICRLYLEFDTTGSESFKIVTPASSRPSRNRLATQLTFHLCIYIRLRKSNLFSTLSACNRCSQSDFLTHCD